MVRATALAVCLLALAAGAAAQLTCNAVKGTTSELILQYVAPALNDDPMAQCLTSVKLELFNDCSVKLTAIQSHGSFVPAMWSASTDPTVMPITNYVECPTESAVIMPVQGTGDKLEAVRRAVIKAFASFVYGVDDYGEYKYELEVPDLDFFPGKLIVKRIDALNLIYAITKSEIEYGDMLQDDDISRLDEVPDCPSMDHNNPLYTALAMCLDGEDGRSEEDVNCPPNSYGVMLVPDGAINAYNEKVAAFKVCAWCPAGTAGDGFGCTTCPPGQFSQVGGGCTDCPPGTYSNAGSSVCIPCPMGTYSNGPGTKECTECPEDTYSWIPGSTVCLRCNNGIPEACVSGVCPTDTFYGGNIKKSSPGTMVVTVGELLGNTGPGTCKLSSANPDYEIRAYTKCKGWDAGALKMAFTVYGDCSIQISPISDPTCAVPTHENETVSQATTDMRYEYGAIQQRAYFMFDGTSFKIRSLFDTTGLVPGPGSVTKSLMLAIDPVPGAPNPELLASWFPATTDTVEGMTNTLIYDKPGPVINPEICTATLTVVGGSLLNLNGGGFTPPDPTVDPTPVSPWNCPDGTYFDAELICPICPVGFKCPGGDPAAADKIPCDPNTYNGVLGNSLDCLTCDGLGPGTYTTYAAAQQCDVERVDLLCTSDTTASFAYDKASQECKLCPAGTFRDYADTTTTECKACDPGYYSAEGAAQCSLCPLGQYNPVPGLPDQTEITGFKCIKCAEGSMPLSAGNEDPATTPLGAGTGATAAEGATFCDACPAGTWLPIDTDACQLCPSNTYRSGDATPENNVCKHIPAGYKLADGNHTSIVLCEKGTVSYYPDNGAAGPDPTARIPGDELTCSACASLDPALWAHTFAPRKGMTQCIPCPGGTKPVPLTTSPVTDRCIPCGNGEYRDAYTVSATCTDCPAGYEVGPSSKMACTQCRPGTFLNQARTQLNTTDANTCELCAINKYRPTFGATSCLDCPRGTQTSNTGNVECTDCPIGYYNNQAGTPCKPAPAGTFVNTTGAFVTTPCPKGSWNNEQAQDNCNPCAPGKYSNTLGSKECKTCPAGTFSAGQASSCIDCRAGYAAPSGAASCSPCKPGTYAPDAKSATCKLCPKGFQCPTNAMRLQGPCPRGTFSNKEGNRLCTPCPVNTYSAGGGTAQNPTAVMACIRCQPGTNTRGLTGQSKCQVIRPQVRRMHF